nr:hypothetical protein CFP56_15845 [Quercus suber]
MVAWFERMEYLVGNGVESRGLQVLEEDFRESELTNKHSLVRRFELGWDSVRDRRGILSQVALSWPSDTITSIN